MSRHEFQYDQQEVDEGKARAFRSTGKFKKKKSKSKFKCYSIFEHFFLT